MSKYKFKKDDIFTNFVATKPSYSVSFHLNTASINNAPMLKNPPVNPAIPLYDLYVAPNGIEAPKILFPSNAEGPIQVNPVVSGESSTGTQKDITELSASLPMPAAIRRSLLIKENFTATATSASMGLDGVMDRENCFKLLALRNTINYYENYSKFFDFSNFVSITKGAEQTTTPSSEFGTQVEMVPSYINMIEVSNLIHGKRIEPGTVKLKYYYTGSLLAEANDKYKDGVLYHTTGSVVGSDIGIVLYNEGIILITGSYDLDSNVVDGYLSPSSSYVDGVQSWMVDNPKWVHFGSYKSFVGSAGDSNAYYGPTSSSYILEFKGNHEIPTITYMAHAPKNELNWSNNPTYVEMSSLPSTASYAQTYVSETGSYSYLENKDLRVKNIESSSFDGHSSSYEPQTYITSIHLYNDDDELVGIAKLANPVKKKDADDYTFKLKLDL